MFSRRLNVWLTLVAFLAVAPLSAFSQASTNIGTDFWIAFPPNQPNSTLQIFISSDFNTSGTIASTYPGVDQNFTVVPGTVTQVTLPSGVALQAGTENKGIHIMSLDPVAVYGLNWKTATTDAFLALPVSSLGTDYRILTYETTLNNNGSSFSVVATENGTTLEVYNHETGVTTSVGLEKGQTYYVVANTIGEDVTGSRIQSNFPVAVYGSVMITDVPLGCHYADHIVEQMWPVSSWGKRFVTVPLAGRDDSGDIFRVLAAEDGTTVSVNGTVVSTLNTGDYYEANLTGYNSIITSNACCVAQFAKGTTCSGSLTGDPFIMLIPPREQFLTNYTIGTVAGFTSHWANVVAPDYALGAIYEDGVLIPGSAFTPIGTTNFSGAQRSITEGSHTYTSTFPFGVFVYGWTTVNSYGYPGGGSLSPVGIIDSITLSPVSASGILNVTILCFTAHVMDDFLNPVEGVLVNFYITGINPLTGNGYTNASGDALFCYTQTGTASGTDSLYAEVFGFISDTAIIDWYYIPPCMNPTDGGSIGNAQSGCNGFTPLTISSITLPSGHTGTLEYKWQQSLTGGGAGFSDITGSNSSTWDPGPLFQSTWFRRLARVDCMSDWSGAALSNEIGITTIPPVPVSVTIAASMNPECEGTPVTMTAIPIHGGSAPVYQWKVNANNAGMNNAVFTYIPVNGDLVSCILTSNETCISNNPDTSNVIALSVWESPAVSFPACFDTVTAVYAKPLRLKGGIPLGGIYSGPGVDPVTGYFHPAIAGPGLHEITYRYANNDGCMDSASTSIINYQLSIINCGDTLTDIRDNKKYPTVQIGPQCWMAANLNYGTMIPGSIHQRDNCIPEKYCYNDLIVNCELQTANYQWDELMLYSDIPGQQGLCTPGWHVPSETDWNDLFTNWTNNAFAGAPLRYSGYSGFNALLPGVWHLNVRWDFPDLAVFFWSSGAHGSWKAWAHGINEHDPSVSLYPSVRSNAFPVRCIRD